MIICSIQNMIFYWWLKTGYVLFKNNALRYNTQIIILQKDQNLYIFIIFSFNVSRNQNLFMYIFEFTLVCIEKMYCDFFI